VASILLLDPACSCSKVRPRYEDEENAQSHSDSHEHERGHGCSGHEKFPDKRLANPGPVHPSVLAETEIRHDEIKFVLIGDEEVCAEGERKDDL
jgi:hypothetical protein